MSGITSFINVSIPQPIRPILFNIGITTVDVEFYLKMLSLILSMFYLIWKWRVESIDRKNKKEKKEL